MQEKQRILRHLDEDYTEPIRDPIWKHIYLSKALTGIVWGKIFQKLKGIMQLGPTYMVYPGATHTRFNHSLGVFHLAKRMITQLVKKQKREFLTLQGVKAFLCAALLHDLGHYPYAHSLKDLAVRDHESLTAEIVLNDREIYNRIEKQLKIQPHIVASIIDTHRDAGNDRTVSFFRNLLSSVLDPDKLDYLNRDAYFCGIPYGIQDIDFIFSQIRPQQSQGFSINSKGLGSVESILFSKYLMYRYVYWHRDVRILTAMIKKGVLLGLKEKAITSDDLYHLDDQAFTALMIRTGSMIAERASRRELFSPALSVPFCSGNRLHLRLENLEERLAFEAETADMLSEKLGTRVTEEDIVVDIPERISFEIDVPILERGFSVPYAESGSVFNADVVKGFVGSLRTVTVLTSKTRNIVREVKNLTLMRDLIPPE